MSDSEALILNERSPQQVVTLTLNRPQAFNALSEAMMQALQNELEALRQDQQVRAVVIAANGRAFCAGHDLLEMRSKPSQAYYQKLFAQCSRMMLAIQQLQVPVIAQVQGIATAAGCQLVATCDLAVASADARFAVSGVNLGLFCSTPGVALSRNLGRKAAFEMLVTGAFISAQQALERGLLNRVVAPENLSQEVRSLTDVIAAKAPAAITLGKQLFYRQLELGVEAAYAEAVGTMACNMMDADALEGVQAFIEKRPPQKLKP